MHPKQLQGQLNNIPEFHFAVVQLDRPDGAVIDVLDHFPSDGWSDAKFVLRREEQERPRFDFTIIQRVEDLNGEAVFQFVPAPTKIQIQPPPLTPAELQRALRQIRPQHYAIVLLDRYGNYADVLEYYTPRQRDLAFRHMSKLNKEKRIIPPYSLGIVWNSSLTENRVDRLNFVG